MRRLVVIVGATAVALGCVGWGTTAIALPSPVAHAVVVGSHSLPACTASRVSRLLYHGPALTVATESPAYAPWFVADNPANGKGFESAMAYALAKQLHINRVTWVVEPFNASYAPGPKAFDFDVDQISITPARAKAVSFSRSYYQVDQALVALPGSRIVSQHSPAQLRTYTFGAQTGTTGLGYVEQRIKPVRPPVSFVSLDQAVSALEAHRIDTFVADIPTARHLSPSQNRHTMIAARLPSGEHYALAFQAHNPLVSCVNQALAALQSNGTLRTLQRTYLGSSVTAPIIKP
jgi:polar amino acid transport system substrate-binding protein